MSGICVDEAGRELEERIDSEPGGTWRHADAGLGASLIAAALRCSDRGARSPSGRELSEGNKETLLICPNVRVADRVM